MQYPSRWKGDLTMAAFERLVRIDDGEFDGWLTWPNLGPYERTSGPYALRRDADGKMRCAFRAGLQHLNGAGTVHGGCLGAFADFALAAVASPVIDSAVTVTLTTSFLAPAYAGDLLEATGRVMREGRLIFIHGGVAVGDRAVLDFSGILRKL